MSHNLFCCFSLGRFSKDAIFDDNAFNLDGAAGCSVVNQDTSRIMSVTLWGLALCEVDVMLAD